jgi:hypothetical protein
MVLLMFLVVMRKMMVGKRMSEVFMFGMSVVIVVEMF